MRKLIQFFKSKSPESDKADTFFKQGLSYRDLGDYKKAKEYLEKALEINSESEIIKLKLWQVEESLKANSSEVIPRNTH